MRKVGRGSRYALLGVIGIATVLSLLVAGYSHRLIGSAGTGAAQHRIAGLNATAGPVLDLSGRSPRTAGLPPKTVALTFDDGPDPQWTPQLLDMLEREHVPATFFVVGSRVLDSPGLVRREVQSGDAVGLHTYTHLDITAHPTWQSRLELSLSQKAIAASGGVTTGLFRPPYSSTPDAASTADIAAWRKAAPNYLTVLADRDSEDWQRPGVSQIVDNSLPTGSEGTIIMMHDGGGDRAQTIQAVEILITRLKAAGWSFVTVPAGLGIIGNGVAPASGATRAQGLALLWAEQGSLWLSSGLGILLAFVTGLTLVRSVMMIIFAHRHAKISRRRNSRRHARIARHRYAEGVRSASPYMPGVITPSVSVIVPAYNEEVGVAATVRSLAASEYPNLEIVVVDDGSTDGTARVVTSLMPQFPQLRLVVQPNGGKARALNRGIAESVGEIVVLIDGDTVVEPETIRRLVLPFSDPTVGGVSGNTKIGNRGGFLGRWQHIEYVVGFNLDRRLLDITNSMNTIPGAVGALRRTVLQQVGGVPVDTLAEDTDLTIMVGLAGWRIAYEGSARAWTEAPADLKSLWRQRYRWAYGLMQTVWKHRRAIGKSAVAGPAGARTRLGRVGLPYLIMFGFLLPLLAPLVDVFGVAGLIFSNPIQTAAVWLIFAMMQFGMCAYALHLDGERKRILWALPFQQIIYRQLMYLVVFEAAMAAMTGRLLKWHKLERAGTAGQELNEPGPIDVASLDAASFESSSFIIEENVASENEAVTIG